MDLVQKCNVDVTHIIMMLEPLYSTNLYRTWWWWCVWNANPFHMCFQTTVLWLQVENGCLFGLLQLPYGVEVRLVAVGMAGLLGLEYQLGWFYSWASWTLVGSFFTTFRSSPGVFRRGLTVADFSGFRIVPSSRLELMIRKLTGMKIPRQSTAIFAGMASTQAEVKTYLKWDKT